MKNLYSFNQQFGRMGSIDGQFRATAEDVAKIMGKTVYFGEALGKHSEVVCDITPENVVLVTDNEEFLSMADKLNVNLDTGYNPLSYYDEDIE